VQNGERRRRFRGFDAKTGEEITRSVLTQIIVEEENKGQNLLPIGFLRQLIGFYGDNMGWLVPRYLEYSMQSLSHNQEQVKDYFKIRWWDIPLRHLGRNGKTEPRNA